MFRMHDGALPRRMGWRGLVLAVWPSLALLAGCAVGPNFKPPQTQVPSGYVGPVAGLSTEAKTAAQVDLAQWWTAFGDPMLTSLEDRAVRSNLDLRQAEARIREARAARGIAVAGLGPTLDASGSYVRTRSPGTSGGKTVSQISNLYQAGFDAIWEMDIFGGIRRGVEAANADLAGAVESRRDVLVTLTAEVATAYIDLRTFQERLDIANRNLEAQKHTADLARQRFQAGFVSGLDVANAEAQVATTTAQIPLLEASAQQSIYGLGVLLGCEPGALLQELFPPGAIPVAPAGVPVGVPSDLLRRRPDIRGAEAQIHAATARIGVAEADLFPRLTLSGSGGFQGRKLDSTFDWVQRFWSFGPSVSWRIFDTGAIRSNIELQRALQEQTVIAYRQVVLTALQEVENALVAASKEADHRTALIEAVRANRKAVELATTLYTAGETDFLPVLDAQRSLYASEDSLAQSSGTVSTDLVALYKSLGGGWDGAAAGEAPARSSGSRPGSP